MLELIKDTDERDLVSISDVVLPQSAYSTGQRSGQKIKVFYISDIHLNFHVDVKQLVEPQIERIVKGLFTDELVEHIMKGYEVVVVFGGDISVDPEWNVIFFHEFCLRWNYYLYKKWRTKYNFVSPMSMKKAQKKYECSLDSLIKEKDRAIKKLRKWMKYDKRHEKMSTYDLVANAKKKGLPDFVKHHIYKIRRLEQRIEDFERRKTGYIDEARKGRRYVMRRKLPVFAVLGNHELHAFNTVSEAVAYYKDEYCKLGVNLLFNEYRMSSDFFAYSWEFSGFMILGGTGFAKYNEVYNANRLIGALYMTREDEIEESERFYEVYQDALNVAKANNKLLIVLTHYPTKDWLPKGEHDSRCVYFTGHTHKNDSVHTDVVNIYANNQVGYHKKEIKFKYALLGTCYNPFITYEDGTYEINTQQYMQFYDYCNDSIGGTGNIERMLRNETAKFYMIKQNGFYGFFVIDQKTGAKICIGGIVKNINKVTQIKYFEESFSAVVNQYVAAMFPYRKIQEKIAAEVQALGYSGRIHGCIVDVDFYNHIMINPLDGQVTYYYSPVYGLVSAYESFHELLHGIDDYGVERRIEQKNNAIALYEQRIKDGEELYIAKTNNELTTHVKQMVKIDVNNSIYALSKRLNQLQRLFASNILRDWNDDFAQEVVNDVSKYFKKNKVTSILGEKAEMKCGMECVVIEDNGYQDITVKFEDGTTVDTTRERFRERRVQNSSVICNKSSNRSVRTVKGDGSFAMLYPDLLEDWDFENNTLKPDEIFPGTNLFAKWKCNKCGYEWEARINRRCTGRSICKNCHYRVIARDAHMRKK